MLTQRPEIREEVGSGKGIRFEDGISFFRTGSVFLSDMCTQLQVARRTDPEGPIARSDKPNQPIIPRSASTARSSSTSSSASTSAHEQSRSRQQAPSTSQHRPVLINLAKPINSQHSTSASRPTPTPPKPIITLRQPATQIRRSESLTPPSNPSFPASTSQSTSRPLESIFSRIERARLRLEDEIGTDAFLWVGVSAKQISFGVIQSFQVYS